MREESSAIRGASSLLNFSIPYCLMCAIHYVDKIGICRWWFYQLWVKWLVLFPFQYSRCKLSDCLLSSSFDFEFFKILKMSDGALSNYALGVPIDLKIYPDPKINVTRKKIFPEFPVLWNLVVSLDLFPGFNGFLRFVCARLLESMGLGGGASIYIYIYPHADIVFNLIP